MVSDYYSGNSAYRFDATASRSGTTITVSISATKLSGSGYWSSASQAWNITIDGTSNNGTWTYDFRGSTPKTIAIASRSKGSLTPGTKSWAASSSLDNGIGSASVAGTVVVPPSVPAAPTIGTPVRNSDTSITVAWTRNATVGAPYDSQTVQRSTDGGAWTNVYTLGTDYTNSGAHSWADTTVTVNHQYRYRVVSTNSAGSGTSAASLYVYTTPTAPPTLTAVKEAAGSITLTLTEAVPYTQYTHTLEYSTDGGTVWTPLTTLATGVLTYSHASPPAGASIQYRAKTNVDHAGQVGTGLASAWKTSNVVPLLSPPNPPSSLVPTGVAFDADDPKLFTWQHNTVDSSAQTAYEIQYRVVGAGSWTSTGKITSTSQSRNFAGGTFVNGQNYEWQVRTWGAHANPSAYSATATFTASNPPSATITSPTDPYAAALVNATWTYFDPEGTAQSSWEATLFRDDVAIEAKSGAGAATSTTFATRLEDATAYELRVRVRDGSSLWSPWAVQAFTTDFPQPPAPVVLLGWDESQGAVSIGITNPAPGAGEVAAEYNVIERSTDGQTWTTVSDNAPLNTTVSDPESPLNIEVMYRVVAWSNLPSSSPVGSNSIIVPGLMGYWSAGPGFGVAVQLRVGYGKPPSIDLSSGLAEKTRHYFAGRTLPVEYAGTAVLREGDVEFMVTTLSDKQTVEQLSLLPAPHLFRLPDGLFLYGSIEPVELKRIDRDVYTVSTSVTEVEK